MHLTGLTIFSLINLWLSLIISSGCGDVDCSVTVAEQISENPATSSKLPFDYPACTGEPESLVLPDSLPSWKATARAWLIVLGELSVSTADLESAKAEGGANVDVEISNDLLLKGEHSFPTVSFQVYVRPVTSMADELQARNGKKVIAFLAPSDLGPTLFLASKMDDALISATSEMKEAVSEIVEQHQALLNDSTTVCEFDIEVDLKVRELIECMTQDSVSQFASLQKLESLGTAAVPSLIRYMDDRRPLAESHIALCNYSPDAFELFRQYGPQAVVDALAAILNQLTGDSFGFIYNRRTEEARDQAVRGWRIYAARLCESTN